MLNDKQKAHACEMLVAAEIILAGGVPAFMAPRDWPEYDVIVEPADRAHPERMSVKSSTFASTNYIKWDNPDRFDWLAIVVLPAPGGDRRRIFIDRVGAWRVRLGSPLGACGPLAGRGSGNAARQSPDVHDRPPLSTI